MAGIEFVLTFRPCGHSVTAVASAGDLSIHRTIRGDVDTARAESESLKVELRDHAKRTHAAASKRAKSAKKIYDALKPSGADPSE